MNKFPILYRILDCGDEVIIKIIVKDERIEFRHIINNEIISVSVVCVGEDKDVKVELKKHIKLYLKNGYKEKVLDR